MRFNLKISSVKLTASQRSAIKAFLVAISFSMLGSGLGVLTNTSTKDLETEISNLSEIENSLKNLTDYVRSQRKALGDISNELNTLKAEKENYETALSLNSQELQATLSAYEHSKQRDKWLGYFVSFFLGVASSIAAYIIIQLWRQYHLVNQ